MNCTYVLSFLSHLFRLRTKKPEREKVCDVFFFFKVVSPSFSQFDKFLTHFLSSILLRTHFKLILEGVRGTIQNKFRRFERFV